MIYSDSSSFRQPSKGFKDWKILCGALQKVAKFNSYNNEKWVCKQMDITQFTKLKHWIATLRDLYAIINGKTIKSCRKVLLHLDSYSGFNPYETVKGNMPTDHYVSIQRAISATE